MGRGFYFIWIIGALLIAAATIVGLGMLNAMALNPTGYTSPTPWGLLIGSASGLVLYWSVLCWALGLLRSKPLWSAGLVAVGLALAYGYPSYDARSYEAQQAEVARHAIVGPMPEFTGKTAVLLWPVDGLCQHNCWNLSRHMEARVLLVRAEDLLAADFGEQVDLLNLPLYEIDPDLNSGALRPASDPPASIDYALINISSAELYDGAFEPFRPQGIAPRGMHIDALITPTRDGRYVDFMKDTPVLRLMSVSRNTASTPWLPGAGRRRYWNSADRLANNEIAKGYFCTSEVRDDIHWCNNAFD